MVYPKKIKPISKKAEQEIKNRKESYRTSSYNLMEFGLKIKQLQLNISELLTCLEKKADKNHLPIVNAVGGLISELEILRNAYIKAEQNFAALKE